MTKKFFLSPAFNAQTMIETLPIQHYANIALDIHIISIQRVQSKNKK